MTSNRRTPKTPVPEGDRATQVELPPLDAVADLGFDDITLEHPTIDFGSESDPSLEPYRDTFPTLDDEEEGPPDTDPRRDTLPAPPPDDVEDDVEDGTEDD